MEVTELAADGLKRQFKIVVPANDLSAKVDERLVEIARTAQIPGFRRGKVPVHLLRKQFGQALFGEAVQKAVSDSIEKTVEDNKLRPALQPNIEVKALGEDKDLEFDVTVEVMPEIDDVDFGAIELERPKVAVEEKAVDEAMERIAAANKEEKELASPRPAARAGDSGRQDRLVQGDGAQGDAVVTCERR